MPLPRNKRVTASERRLRGGSREVECTYRALRVSYFVGVYCIVSRRDQNYWV